MEPAAGEAESCRVRPVDRGTTGDEDVVGLRAGSTAQAPAQDRRRTAVLGLTGVAGRRLPARPDSSANCTALHFPTTVPVCPLLPCPRPFAITCAVPNRAPAPSRSPNTCVAAELTHCASPILVPRSQTETACAQLLSPKNTHTQLPSEPLVTMGKCASSLLLLSGSPSLRSS
jgi:hypothetical protein